MEPMIQVENLCKRFETKGGTVEAAKTSVFLSKKERSLESSVSPVQAKVHWCDV